MAKDGTASGIARDRKYTSKEEHEKAYKGDRKSRVRYYQKHEKGGKAGGLDRKIKIRGTDDNKIYTWTLGEVIDRINEDNASDEFNYNEGDWIEGFKETLEGQFYSLNDKNGKPLNDLSKMEKGGKAGKDYLYFYAKDERPYVLFKTKNI